MKQTARIISTYTADVSGVASALFELGGMTVMHDASGCNSTYNTHDEPRWYDMPSMVFLSALWETEAMLGDESRIINDISKAALELKPRFIAIAGTPIPMMMGTDFHGLYNDKVISIGDYGTPDDALSKLMGYKAKQKRLLKKAQKLAEEKAAENA